MNKIAILSAGPGLPEIVEKYGHSSDWIPQILSTHNIEFDIIKVYRDNFKFCYDYDAYIITGSKYSVYDDVDWISRLKDYLSTIIQTDKPILGICFGHQLLAEVLGGNVIKNPKGWELGSYQIQLTESGLNSPLFKDILNNEIFYESHQDFVECLPANSTELSTSDKGNQSFVYNDKIFGVQFHPEFSWDVTRMLMDLRIKKGIKVDDETLDKSSKGPVLLNNFIDIIERIKNEKTNLSN